MNSVDRALGLLKLFSVDKPVWTAEAAARELGVSVSQAYRYLNSLAKAGLVDPAWGMAGFLLGPAITEYDRLIQACDPMLQAARPIMEDLSAQGPGSATVLLCRRHRDLVMCVSQVVGRAPQAPISYERGRPMPMLRGASSKVILANLPARAAKRFYAEHGAEARAAGMGADWTEFSAGLQRIRRQGHAVSMGEIDPGRVGLAAPIFDVRGGVVGSIGFALPAAEADDRQIRWLTPLIIAAARAIEAAMSPAAAVSLVA